MASNSTCPRCGGPLKAPGYWSSAWECERHGPVAPLFIHPVPSAAAFTLEAKRARVPIWVPWPLPAGWVVAGIGAAGDDRTGARATVVACSGPAPLGGPADMLFVAEEPGVGLGAGYAGIDGTDPDAKVDGPPHAKLTAAGHVAPLWPGPSADDRVSFVGEAKGIWLWVVLWPPSASVVVMLDELQLRDMREGGAVPDLPFGAQSPRLDRTVMQ